MEKIHLLSISTGFSCKDKRLGGKQHNFGIFQWLPYLMDFLIDSTTRATHYNVKSLLGPRYHRIVPRLHKPFELNDVEGLDELSRIGKQVDLEQTFLYLEQAGLKRRQKS